MKKMRDMLADIYHTTTKLDENLNFDLKDGVIATLVGLDLTPGSMPEGRFAYYCFESLVNDGAVLICTNACDWCEADIIAIRNKLAASFVRWAGSLEAAEEQVDAVIAAGGVLLLDSFKSKQNSLRIKNFKIAWENEKFIAGLFEDKNSPRENNPSRKELVDAGSLLSFEAHTPRDTTKVLTSEQDQARMQALHRVADMLAWLANATQKPSASMDAAIRSVTSEDYMVTFRDADDVMRLALIKHRAKNNDAVPAAWVDWFLRYMIPRDNPESVLEAKPETKAGRLAKPAP